MGLNQSLYDVAIVGRGIAGLSLARELLLETSLKIALIGPDEPHADSGTIAAQGVCSVKGLVLGRDPLFCAKLAGHKHTARWIRAVARESEHSIPFEATGVGEITRTVADYQALVGRAYQRRFQGVFGPINGQFGSDGHKTFGVVHPEDYWFDPKAALAALTSLVLKACNRLTVIPRASLGIDGLDRGLSKVLLAGGESVLATRIVVAAGAATPRLLGDSVQGLSFNPGWRFAGGETFTSRCQGASGVAFERPGGRDHRVVTSFVRGTSSVTRRPDGKIVVGSTTGEKPGDYKINPVESMGYEIALMAGETGNQPASIVSWESRWGVRLRTRDRSPICGPIAGTQNRLWLFSGFYKNGLQLAPMLAAAMVQSIATNGESKVSSHFTPGRFGS